MISSVLISRGYILALEEELSNEDILSAADTTFGSLGIPSWDPEDQGMAG